MKKLYYLITGLLTIYFIVLIHVIQLDRVGLYYDTIHDSKKELITLADMLCASALISLIPIGLGICICSVISNSEY